MAIKKKLPTPASMLHQYEKPAANTSGTTTSNTSTAKTPADIYSNPTTGNTLHQYEKPANSPSGTTTPNKTPTTNTPSTNTNKNPIYSDPIKGDTLHQYEKPATSPSGTTSTDNATSSSKPTGTTTPISPISGITNKAPVFGNYTPPQYTAPDKYVAPDKYSASQYVAPDKYNASQYVAPEKYNASQYIAPDKYNASQYVAPEKYSAPQSFAAPPEYTASQYNAPSSYAASSYAPSEAVNQATQMLADQMAKEPGQYNSPWATQLNDTLDKILNREKFSYDFNGDAFYQQYKDKFTQQARAASDDAIARASALTGGYGNSYAATVGAQAYNAEMQQLNDVIPELYQMAYDRYAREGQDLKDAYSMLSAREQDAYGRYRDEKADYLTDRDYFTNRLDAEKADDYNKFLNDRNFGYNQYVDDRNFGYNQYVDDRNYNYGKYVDDRNFGYNQYVDDRNFGYNQYVDDRNFGYAQHVDDRNFNYGQYVDDRNFGYNQHVDDRNFGYAQHVDDRNFGYNQYVDDRNFGYGQYVDDRNFGYGQHIDDRNFNYGQYVDDRNFGYGQYVDDRNFGYNANRDTVADQKWQSEFDLAVDQFNKNLELSQREAEAKQQAATDKATADRNKVVDDIGKELPEKFDNNEDMANYLAVLEGRGEITVDEAMALLDKYAYADYKDRDWHIEDIGRDPFGAPGVETIFKDQYGNSVSYADIIDELKASGMSQEEADKWMLDLLTKLHGNKEWGN